MVKAIPGQEFTSEIDVIRFFEKNKIPYETVRRDVVPYRLFDSHPAVKELQNKVEFAILVTYGKVDVRFKSDQPIEKSYWKDLPDIKENEKI